MNRKSYFTDVSFYFNVLRENFGHTFSTLLTVINQKGRARARKQEP